MNDRLRVLYVAGYVRSGSTLLDRILGGVEGFCSVGELGLVWERGFLQGRPCACGAPFHRCPFWNDVADAVFGGMRAVKAPEVVELRSRVDRWWRTPGLASDRASWPAGAEREAYVDLLRRLLEGIRAASGCDVIVDSTKEASHGHLVRRVGEPVELAVVHLVRDPRAVAYSLCDRRKFDPGLGTVLQGHTTVRVCAAWSVTNLLVDGLRRGVPTSMVQRYEDLVAEPRGSVARVLQLVDAGDRRLPLDDDGNVVLAPNHAVAGNPDRFGHGTVRIRADEEWRERLSRGKRTFVTAATGPLLGRYPRTPQPRAAW
jgi:sulfotransferase family protein